MRGACDRGAAPREWRSEPWQVWHRSASSSPAGAGSSAGTSWRRSRLAGCTVLVPRKAQYDLTRVADVERMYADFEPHVVHPPGGGGRRHRRQPRVAGPFFYENVMMGALTMEHARRSGVEKFVGIGTICAYPEAGAGAVSRARSLERLPGRDQRAVRHRQEDAAGAGAGLPPAVRLQRHPPAAGQPLRAARQLRSEDRRT